MLAVLQTHPSWPQESDAEELRVEHTGIPAGCLRRQLSVSGVRRAVGALL